MDQNIDELSSQEATRLLMSYGPDAKIFNKKKNGQKNFGNGFTKMQFYWMNLKCLLSQGIFRYMVFYIAVSIAGSFISEIVYCFHLLDIIDRFPTLQNVIKAVTTNIKQLGLTSFLGVIFIYIYTLFAFYFADDTYIFGGVTDEQGNDAPENQCTSLLQCFIVNTNFGLIKGGGIGDATQPQPYYPKTDSVIARFYFKWLFDVSFFLLIKMAFLNIIFGVIIDTFAQLRDEKTKKEEDMKNVCFICSLQRETKKKSFEQFTFQFDRFADGFENHIERDHQLWFYVYYVYHVNNKDSNDHNGIESYVYEQYCKQEYNWFPMLRSMSIQQDQENNYEAQIEEKMGQMKMMLEKLSENVSNYIEEVDKKKN